jgi:hypothetical protein
MLSYLGHRLLLILLSVKWQIFPVLFLGLACGVATIADAAAAPAALAAIVLWSYILTDEALM